MSDTFAQRSPASNSTHNTFWRLMGARWSDWRQFRYVQSNKTEIATVPENINDALLWALIGFAPRRYYRGSTTPISPECFNHHCTVLLDSNLHKQIKHDWRFDIERTTHYIWSIQQRPVPSESKNGVNLFRINRRLFSFSLLEIFFVGLV
jgi:hypothetical protein